MKNKLKVWFILKEDISYTSFNLVDIAVSYSNKEFINNKRKEWINNGSLIKVNLVFNNTFINKIEEYLINNGISFTLIYKDNIFIGIFIEPTLLNLRDNILSDCMTLEEFAKNRKDYLNELEKEESEN